MTEEKTAKELLAACNYSYIGRFSDGIAVAGDDKHIHGFHILPDGRRAYEESYEAVCDFREGFARVLDKGKWFHVGTDGKPAYEERYDSISNFERNTAGKLYARVSKNGTVSLIRPDGTKAS